MTSLCPPTSLRSSGTESVSASAETVGSLELGGHLVDANLGAVVVPARLPGHTNRADHVGGALLTLGAL